MRRNLRSCGEAHPKHASQYPRLTTGLFREKREFPIKALSLNGVPEMSTATQGMTSGIAEVESFMEGVASRAVTPVG
ncbi:hypothetical protein B0T16DRAFT_398933 [Cercophora newfieldiana]|uniref:Uncharacterized protein n=1 Tax=Cercophora newfieldiana TaxID=92897 RepID=A0AA39YQG9_9PEZI|nr:hypothetical protein B0T16DRAFT_398933 [Cercophora newfieldiana]